jgi:LmbE family N-acetylglucosaminyl deacetylase
LLGILAGFGSREQWFCGVVVTDGGGSARDDLYADYTDEQMKQIRRVEQKKAAFVGEFGAAVFLDHPSAAVKDPNDHAPERDLRALLEAARPEVVYIHNLADKHPTHIGVSLQAIRALRSLPKEQRPRKLYGCEVWRDLDWMLDSDKVVFRLDKHENIAVSLVGVFDSQIVGGKRYDLATMGRRRAHATYHESHSVDASSLINFGMDLTPLIEDDSLDVGGFVLAHIDRFRASVRENLARFA